jgi:hypothetical protein
MVAPAAGEPWIPAYVGIGSNLDDPVRQVRQAIMALRGLSWPRASTEARPSITPGSLTTSMQSRQC